MNKCYSTFEVKGINEETRTIKGIASTPTPDRDGDIVEPTGAKFNLPIPLLWQHNHDQPIGHVTRASVTRKGIEVSADIMRIDEPGALQDRLTEAWQSIKSGLVRGFSIGFKPLEAEQLDDWALHFKSWEWLELSAVTIPANADASIQAIKRYDTETASSRSGVVTLSSEEVRRAGRNPNCIYLR